MIRVLMVCLGNICRSPMAEAVLRKQIMDAGLADKIEVDSAGTGDWHIGKPPHEGTQRILNKHGIEFQGMTARQSKSEDFDEFNYIIAMDASNVDNLEKLRRNSKRPIHLLLDFGPERATKDVPDPYYTGNFEEVYEMIHTSCRHLLAWIREQEQLG